MTFALRCALALALLAPALAFAHSHTIDIANEGGLLLGSSAGLSLAGSEFDAAAMDGKLFTGNLGLVEFTTGSLISGTLKNGGTFGTGGDFILEANGTDGIHSGFLFIGHFTGPEVWTELTLANGTHNYTLSGTVAGGWWDGASVDGITVQLTVNTGTGLFTGSAIPVSSGNTAFSGQIGLGIIPEPGTMTMFGTGLITLAGLVRRKLKLC